MKKTLLYVERDEGKRAAFRAKFADIDLSRLVFVDETGVDHNARLTRGWGRKGQLLLGERPGKRTGRTSIIAALNNHRLIAPFCFEGYCTTNVFQGWVDQCFVHELIPGQIVIIDNARFHQAPSIRASIEKVGCTLEYLPPYSPDMNDIEPWWAPLKHIYEKIQHSFDTPQQAVDAALSSLCAPSLG